MRVIGIVGLITAVFCLQTHAQNSFGPTFNTLQKLETDFMGLAVDIRQVLGGMPTKGTVEYACVNTMFFGAFHMSVLFSHYKFTVASMNVVSDPFDKVKVRGLVKIQTELADSEVMSERKRVNGALGTCSKFSLSVAKGTELLGMMKRADEAIKSVVFEASR